MAKRNAKKDIETYKNKFWTTGQKAGLFYLDDISQIYDISKDLCESINNALMFGFMVGYRRGKKERKGV